jgi:hypothetical protein
VQDQLLSLLLVLVVYLVLKDLPAPVHLVPLLRLTEFMCIFSRAVVEGVEGDQALLVELVDLALKHTGL